MDTTSPSKRRALAPVDANTRSPLGAPRLSPSKLDLPKSTMALGTSPIEASTTKRAIDQENDQEMLNSAKKRRLSSARTEPLSPQNQRPLQPKEVDTTPRPRSTSPEESSVFDNSTIDNSQVTVISEPDVETAAAPAPALAPAVTETRPRQGSMTREEARQKAEILRLRLGLASYKVKTNQADVPLEKLQVRPIPGRFPKQSPQTVLLPPFLAASPRSLAAMSQRDEGKRLSSPARIEVASSRKVFAMASSPIRKEPASSISYADIDRSPFGRQEPEQTPLPVGLNTPQRTPANEDIDLLDNERGGAAEGLLSLSQSSPASVLR
ncbi:hypothetical protein F4825DRAFT_410732 [Nemania diffusa]|nr:hypothetical protein F4825DRAFT_410732 [Nemania diffusa]